MRSDFWNEERLDLLRTLWASGATAQSIADQLGGVSRSGVLGKIFRLRLGGAATARQPVTSATPIGSGMPPPSPARRRRSSKPSDLPRTTEAAASRRGKSLLELSNECCRWPHGRPGAANFFFCGAPEADLERGMPYCARHARRAYLTPPQIINGVEAKPMAGGDRRPAPAPAPARRYIWRSAVRHPASRWR